MNRIFLIGFMGCGKSTVGRNLARALNWKFIDLDQFIQEQEGLSITEIFNQQGEEVFRLLEKNALEKAATLENVVIATGGGAPCHHNNLERMKESGLTIYLKLEPEGLLERLLAARKSRPLIANKSDDELLLFIREKLAEREPFYNQASVIADASVTGIEPYLQLIKRYQ